MQNVKCKIIIILVPWLFLQFMSSTAFAHKVNVFAYVEEDMVYTESYFPDGKKVAGGIIEVYDTEGKKLLEGKTDNVGQFNFKVPLALLGTAKSLPKKGDLKIILNASLGHRATYTITASEINPAPPSDVLNPAGKICPTTYPRSKLLGFRGRCGIKDIAKKERPKGVSLRGIIAGIGFILGITGIFMFFLSRKRKDPALLDNIKGQ